NVGNQNGLIGVQGNANQNENGNLIAERAKGNATGHNGNQIRCYNCRGVGHFARNYMVRPRRRDVAYLQTLLLIVQKEEAGIQLQAEEFELMAAAVNLDEIEEANANYILMANLQQASTSSTQTDKAPVYDSDGLTEKIALGYQNPFYLKQAQKKQQSFYDGVFVSQTDKSREELYFSDISKTANVSTSTSIPNEEFSDDTTPSVARKLLNEVKSTIVTLQRVVKHRMTLETHNLSSSAHQELHKIIKDENFPIVNQVDARVKNFEIKFLKEAAKFFGDFKSLAKEADESLAKHKALELEIEHLLRAVVSQDIMSVMQKASVVDTSKLQTEQRTKERFKNCIIKKENEYAKLWNDWYKKCEECKFDKILYDKSYNDMQQKIERLQAQFGDLKGKSKDTSCVSDTLNPLSQKLENENVELEFHVLNYAKENAHLRTTHKNLFDSISMSRTQTKTIIASLQNKLHNTIYENANLRAQLFNKIGETHALSKIVTLNSIPTPQESKVMKNDKVIAPGMFRINPFKTSREEKHVPNKDRASVRTKSITVSQHPVFAKKDDNTQGTSTNTKFAKQSILGKPPKVGEIQALSKPVTSNSIPTPQESKVLKNDKVIAPGMFRINPVKPSRKEKHVPDNVRASVRTKPIIVSQPPVITKKVANSDSNGLSSTGVDNTAKTRRPKPRSNTKNNRAPSVSRSSCRKNKEAEVAEHPRDLLLSKNKKHMSSECNNVKLATQNVNSKAVCAMCKQCLISVNHDHKAQVWKPKNVGSKEGLASPKHSTPRSCLRWSPTGRLFNLKGKIIASSKSESQSDCSNGDNACSSNPQELIGKRFPNSTFSMTGQNWFDTLLIPLLFEYKPMDKEDHGDNKCVT
nr:hypothetical protein [Tanacetum cinerariifolium]